MFYKLKIFENIIPLFLIKKDRMINTKIVKPIK